MGIISHTHTSRTTLTYQPLRHRRSVLPHDLAHPPLEHFEARVREEPAHGVKQRLHRLLAHVVLFRVGFGPIGRKGERVERTPRFD